jgi:hypothetical protein
LSDDGEEGVTQDDRGDDDDAAATTPHRPEVQGAGALVPKRFRASTDQELDPQRFMVGDRRVIARTTLRGGSVAADRGDARFIGEAIQRLATTLRQIAELYREGKEAVTNPLLRQVVFGGSVTLEFEVAFEEPVHIGLDGSPHSPTIDAARTVGELLAASPDQLVKRAVELGPNATNAYRSFLNVIAKDQVTLEWEGPDSTDLLEVTSDHARLDAAALTRPGQREVKRVVIPGTLSMADSELHQFKLTLPPEVERPPLLKNKHRIHGSYRLDLGPKLKESNLWDSDVYATIDVSYDVPGSTPVPGEKTFLLVDAEPLIAPPSLFDDLPEAES